MNTRYFFVSLLFLFSFFAFSQEVTKLQEYLPPSPTAQEFIKYGEYPVGMYTGVPNISIPLYNIDVKDIKVPISLSYHSAGVQVDQIASWVGLGWSLNVGGRISKIPRGIPDDESSGFLTYTVPELNNLVFDDNFYEDAATGLRDTESDIYHYNFAGYSGKFFFDRTKNIRLIDEAPIKITYTPSSPGIASKFIITTKNGITFEFHDVETTDTVSYSLGNPSGTGTNKHYTSSWLLSKITSKNKVDTVTFTYEAGASFSSHQYSYSESTGSDVTMSTCPPSIILNVHSGGGSQIASQIQSTQNPKRLKEIIFPNGKVSFNRVSDRLDINPERLIEIVISQKNGANYSKIKSYEFTHAYFYSSHTGLFPTINPSAARRNRLKLLELHEYNSDKTKVKKHLFEYNNTMLPPIETNAKDFWGYYNGKNTNVNLIPLQPFQYLGNNVGAADRNPDANFMKAGILNKITYPTGGYTEFSYEPHEYISSETSTIAKTKSVFAVGEQNIIGGGVYLEDSKTFTPNYSGYATLSIEASDRSSVSGVYPKITLQVQGSSTYMIVHSIDPTEYSYPMNPPEIFKTFSPVWLDEGVTYVLKAEAEGTSNSTEFDGAAYMKADIDYNEESTTTTPVTKIAGGLRIQQIKSYSKESTLAFSKRYEYKNEQLITPEAFIKEQYLDISIQKANSCQYVICGAASTTRRFYYGGTVQSLTLNGGSPVVYGAVDEFVVDGLNNNLGKTNYTYNTQTDAVLPVPSAYQGGIMILKKDWMGGQNISTKTYDKNAINDNDFLSSEINGYTLKKYDESYKMYKIIHDKRYSGCYIPSVNRYNIIEYPIYRGTKLLSSSQKTTKYNGVDEVVTNTSIFYDNDTHLQATRTETTGSDSKTIITKTRYPDDIKTKFVLEDDSNIIGGVLEDSEFDAVDRMKVDDLHQMAIPVQVETYKDDGVTETLLSIQRTNFNEAFTNVILPESIEIAKGTSSLKDRINYNSYYDNGNVKEVSKTDGTHIVYVWGYNEQYPIAKIENATFVGMSSGIQTIIDTAVTASNNDIDTSTENSLRSALNNVRNEFPNAMVTTYTYDPLIGVTSITDPKGYTMYYEYDDFNRLKQVKDTDGKILSENQYHYKGQ